MTGAWRPFIGNLPEIANYEVVSVNSDEPLPMLITWLQHYYIDPEDSSSCKFENHKASLINFFGKPTLCIMNPKCVEDIWYTKNKLVDKSGVW